MNQAELDDLRVRGTSVSASAFSTNRHHELYIELVTSAGTFRLDPNADISNTGWSAVGGASGVADALAGVAVDPANGETGKRLAVTSAGPVYEIALSSRTLGVGETITSLTLHIFCDRTGGTAQATVQMFTGATPLGSALSTEGGTAWRTVTYTPPSATVHERSAALSAATGIASSGTFFSVLSRSAAVSAATSVASSGQRDLLRSASVSVAGAITVAHQRELQRSVAASATAAIATDFERELERAVSAASATGIAVTFERDLLRAADLGAVADINATGQVENGPVVHERSASLSASGAITASGHGILERAAQVAAATSIDVSVEFWSILEREVAVSAATSVETEAEAFSILERSVALAATGTIATAQQRDLLRTVSLSAAASISLSAERELTRSVALSATTQIATAGGRFSRGWPQDTDDAWAQDEEIAWAMATDESWE